LKVFHACLRCRLSRLLGFLKCLPFRAGRCVQKECFRPRGSFLQGKPRNDLTLLLDSFFAFDDPSFSVLQMLAVEAHTSLLLCDEAEQVVTVLRFPSRSQDGMGVSLQQAAVWWAILAKLPSPCLRWVKYAPRDRRPLRATARNATQPLPARHRPQPAFLTMFGLLARSAKRVCETANACTSAIS